MIFVTVGTDLPFDRLVRAVDEWAAHTKRSDVFAQIGETNFRPSYIKHAKFIAPSDFNRHFSAATTIISHAGMGTILSALRFEKPILVLPRLASLSEHRNEHQLATARHLLGLGKVNVAFDVDELRTMLDRLDKLRPRERIGAFASPELLSAIREFIFQ